MATILWKEIVIVKKIFIHECGPGDMKDIPHSSHLSLETPDKSSLITTAGGFLVP